MPNRETLTITDNRTGKSYEVPVVDGTIQAIDLRQIKVSDSDFGLMTYDPGFTNTASCRSAVTFIDGDQGILRHRGYPIEELAQRASYTETVYLLFNGELPNKHQLSGFEAELRAFASVPEELIPQLGAFPPTAHPMSVLISTLASVGTHHADASNVQDPKVRRMHMMRIVGMIPTLAAWAQRQAWDAPIVHPNENLSYTANFLHMLKGSPETPYEPHADVVRALDVLFLLHADHEQNCSTNAMRSIGSSLADPYAATAGAVAALSGPLHGGANEAVLRMLREIGTKDRVKDFVRSVKDGSGGRLMGFGHRVYKNYDPRAQVIKKLADRVFELLGTSPLLDVAVELEKHALSDEYFSRRKLYPNVDFYSGLIYEALEIPVTMFPVMFAVARASGWLAQWEELMLDKDQRIARPRQIYTGKQQRRFIPIEQR